jgi:hypothetical protein
MNGNANLATKADMDDVGHNVGNAHATCVLIVVRLLS